MPVNSYFAAAEASGMLLTGAFTLRCLLDSHHVSLLGVTTSILFTFSTIGLIIGSSVRVVIRWHNPTALAKIKHDSH